MSNKVYDILKYIALVLLPALIVFTGVVLTSLNVECADVVLTIMSAFNTFLGTILKLSSDSYNSKNQ